MRINAYSYVKPESSSHLINEGETLQTELQQDGLLIHSFSFSSVEQVAWVNWHLMRGMVLYIQNENTIRSRISERIV